MGTGMKESYETLRDILDKIRYEEQNWKLCCDLKVINILQGIIDKGGFPKFFCFLCDWNSRYQGNHYTCTDWTRRTADSEGALNLRNKPAVKNTENILLPPLHIKLGIAKKFIETAVKYGQTFNEDEVFLCLKSIFPKLSDAKIRNGIQISIFHSHILISFNVGHIFAFQTGILNGPDIRKLMRSEDFENALERDHLKAWHDMKAVIEGVLGKNRKAPDEVKILVNAMLGSFERIGASMTLKLHFLHFHLDDFLKQLPTESDEQVLT